LDEGVEFGIGHVPFEVEVVGRVDGGGRAELLAVADDRFADPYQVVGRPGGQDFVTTPGLDPQDGDPLGHRVEDEFPSSLAEDFLPFRVVFEPLAEPVAVGEDEGPFHFLGGQVPRLPLAPEDGEAREVLRGQFGFTSHRKPPRNIHPYTRCPVGGESTACGR
jgi:hypothetical protein